MVGTGQGLGELGQPGAVRVEVGPYGEGDARAAVGCLRGVHESRDEPLPLPHVAAEGEHFLELIDDHEQFLGPGAGVPPRGEDPPHHPVEGARLRRESGVHRGGRTVGAGRQP